MSRLVLPRQILSAGVALLALYALPALSQEVSGGEEIATPPAADEAAFSLTWSETEGVAFTLPTPEESGQRIELELAADGGPVDVSLTRRAIIGDADQRRRGGGAELRVGHGLVERRSGGEARDSAYIFVASDNEALTWRPGDRGAALALQEQVEIGDLSAGVAIERGDVQASIAYVEREESTRVGNESFSQDESFAGVTVTVRR